MSSDRVIIEKQMGITHAEFLRLLPQALGTDDYDVSGQGSGTLITFAATDDQEIRIALGQESVRQIALMRIPTTPVTLTFQGLNDTEMSAFMATFDRAYQRGGG